MLGQVVLCGVSGSIRSAAVTWLFAILPAGIHDDIDCTERGPSRSDARSAKLNRSINVTRGHAQARGNLDETRRFVCAADPSWARSSQSALTATRRMQHAARTRGVHNAHKSITHLL